MPKVGEGKLLKRLCDGYPFAKNIITTTVQTNYPLGLDDLPAWDDFEGCRTFTAKLCQDYTVYIPTNDEVDAEQCITQNEDNLVGPLHINLDVNEDKVKDMDDVSMDASTDLVLANHSVDRSSPSHIPVTLKHFQMLARLGRAPELSMYSNIETGAEFYRDEEEYVRPDEKGKCNAVKAESASTTLSPTKNETSPSMTMRRRKRPRRSATNIGSYAVPDSDDDVIADDEPIIKKPPVVETSIQLWMKHLNEIMKQEQRKFKEKKKKAELLEPGVKTRVTKSEFFKSLSSHLRNLQKLEEDKRLAIYGPDVLLEVYTDDDDDDDYRRKTRTKRRKSLRSL
ncbi:hypothetical protein H0H81_005692 [Sphagnurus paluster]|uniref:Uncharacterized protein n=1 Tax=Sphagnurus paluster TaxID=117069 RepID=A0A9P7FZG6_9AGAR|nr:hypothetical protein H0H81_005692 [Sphagnurus paluster]